MGARPRAWRGRFPNGGRGCRVARFNDDINLLTRPSKAGLSSRLFQRARRAGDCELLARLRVGRSQLGVPITKLLNLLVQPQIEHQFRSERPHSPDNDGGNDDPDHSIGRGKMQLRAGGFWLGSAQDVIWVDFVIKPARNGLIIFTASAIGKTANSRYASLSLAASQ
jgi:hypothetical protein